MMDGAQVHLVVCNDLGNGLFQQRRADTIEQLQEARSRRPEVAPAFGDTLHHRAR
jgi:hypothetical protein